MLLTIFFFLSLALNLCFSETQSTTTTTYVIHMDRLKMEALEVSIRSQRTWYEELIESVRISSSSNDEEQPDPILLYVYQHTICGISTSLTAQQLQTLQTMDGYLHATEGKLLNLLTTHSPQFLDLQKGQGLWSRENLASDVIIGVLDTGIWPEHPSFLENENLPPVPPRWKGKCKNYTGFDASSCNKKLIGAEVFYKGYEEMMIEDKTNDTSEYKSPRDSFGHGTHTASTAGGNFVPNASIFGMANGTAAGMRPTARIAAYKVCFQYGCADSDILAAIDRAVHDGVDVLSISIGGFPWPYFDDLLAIGAFHAVQKGVIVSLSAGNSGSDSYTVCNGAPWLMTVGASSTDRDFLVDVYLGDGTKLLGSSLSSHETIKKASLVYNQTKGPNLCLNGSLSRSLVKGKIVICDRGIKSRGSKDEEVKRAGGAAMILANTPENGEERIADLHVLPTVALGATAANIIREYVNSSKYPIASTIQFRRTVYHKRAPLVASFSSRGPSTLDPNILKPDLTAPGVNILAAFPPNSSKTDKRHVWFNIMSGTSMSCPHVSGLIALLKSVHRDWSPAAIKSALMTTAYVLDSNYSPISDMSDGKSPANPFALGSGHVDVNKASDPGLIYDILTQDYLNYLCTLNYNSTQMKLFSGRDNTCPTGSRFTPGDLNYPSFSVILDAKSRCKKFTTTHKRTVTNVGNSEVTTTYHVKVNEPEGVSITVNPRVLKFTRNKYKLSYNVTFKAKGMSILPKTSNFSFGDIKWVSGKYSVRSPIAVIWNKYS